MKKYFTLMAWLMPYLMLSQGQIWQTPVVSENTPMRLPEPLVLDSITVDIPAEGKVFVRFDGNCVVSPGDRIVLAASDHNEWVTNDGNTDVRGADTIHTKQCFNHSRIYNAVPGIHTYYAIGHNYVDTEGTGIASVYGHLTVEYVPAENSAVKLDGEGLSMSVFYWNDTVEIFRQVTIEAPVTGRLLVNFDGRIYMSSNDTAYITTNLDESWPGHSEIEQVIQSEQLDIADYVHRKVYEVDAGTHEVFAMGIRNSMEPFDTDLGIYGTFSVQFIPDGVPEAGLVSETIEERTLFTGDHLPIEELEIVTPEAGKVWLHFTGLVNSGLDDRITLSLVQKGAVDTVLNEQLVQSVLDLNPHTYFSNSGYAEVEAGTHRFEVIAEFDHSSNGHGEADIRGLFTAQFFGPPPVTAVEDETGINNGVVFYPNPSTGLIYAREQDPSATAAYEITVNDALGHVVMQKQGHTFSEFSIDLSPFPEGMYLIRIQQGAKTEIHKVNRISGGDN